VPIEDNQPIDQSEIERVSQVNDTQVGQPEKEPEESALEKEWREIKQQNEQDRTMTMNSNQPIQNFEHALHKNNDGSLNFYWFDAHEESYGSEIYLFGKVWQPETNSFVSCSVKVKGMERTLFALPKMKANKARGSLSEDEEKAQQQAMILDFNNLRKERFKQIPGFKCKFVSRKYAFEMPISHGEHKFLKIKYSAEYPPLPSNLTGNTFECIFGAN
jgi:DNA polymerase alpha subunit A